ncbi:MAG: 2-dehydro-3-deoxygluconokinase [Clostridia bacterium]|nr:2-dehydro-3-deoxygluconokinase [Clostridia bacterium]
MAEVITLGEPLVVLIAQETGELKDVTCFSRGIAGAEINVAISLTRLGHSCSYITRLGTDPFGQYIYDFIKSVGIDYTNIYLDEEHLTGTYLKSKPLNGDPITSYYRKNSAASYMDEDNIEKVNFDKSKLLHITGISPALSKTCVDAVHKAIQKAREANMIVSFDTNIRKVLWKSDLEMKNTLNNIAFKCDIVLPGIEEGLQLTGKSTPEEIADFYLENGSKIVVVKLGKSGAYFKSKNDSGYVKGFKVDNVVDTVGAGDGFASGFLSGMIEGRSLKEAVIIGNAVASIIIQSKEDNAELPTKDQLNEYIVKYYSE